MEAKLPWVTGSIEVKKAVLTPSDQDNHIFNYEIYSKNGADYKLSVTFEGKNGNVLSDFVRSPTQGFAAK